MGNKRKIIDLFKEANGNGSYKFKFYVLTIPLVVLIAIGFAFGSHYNKSRANGIKADNMNKGQLVERVETLNNRLHNTKMAALYARDIDIRKIRTTEIPEGGIFLRGEIKNNSKYSMGDIGLTVYGLNESNYPVYEKDIMTVSTDGKPLTWHIRRKFSAVLSDAPYTVKEIVVIVNSVDIADAIIQERPL